MKPATLTVFIKEFLENLRDRRTVLTALVLGPLFGPVLFGVMLNLTLSRNLVQSESPVALTVVNPKAAPHLLEFLESNGAELIRVDALPEADVTRLIETRQAKAVLVIDDVFGERLLQGDPAPAQLYADSSRSSDQRDLTRISALLDAYNSQIVSQRLVLRGLDPALLRPLAVETHDVATPAARALLLLSLMSFFLILSLLTGGMYLAIDTTVGERERGTLEPLLATPVSRESLLIGKLLATSAYMLLSMIITTVALFFVLRRIDIEQLGMSANLDWHTALSLIGVTATLIPLFAGGMTFVAAFTRSSREAQAWISVLQLMPTLPLVFAGMMNLAPALKWMWVPSLSQHLLITQIMRGDTIEPRWLIVAMTSSALIGLALVAFTARLYRRESLLA